MQQNPSILLKGALSIYLSIYLSIRFLFFLPGRQVFPSSWSLTPVGQAQL